MSAKISAQLTITMTDDGQLNVNGPIANKILCYGMLELARDVVAKQGEQTGPRLVVAAAGSVPPPKSH